MSNTSGAGQAPSSKPGDTAFAIAQQQLNKPYVYGATGPDSFDCSGLMYYSYFLAPNSPHINVGRDTNAEWNQNKQVCDAFAASGSGTPSTITANDLQVGDLLLYFQPGNSGTNAHVKMYAGGGQTIEAPHTGDVVKMNPLDLKGDASEPFRGVVRPGGGTQGAGAPAGGGGGNSAQGSGDGQQPTGDAWQKQAADMKAFVSKLKDPRTNLPFSAAFQRNGSLRFVPPNVKGASSISPSQALVRGGMVDLSTHEFKCYFMMNPQSISTDCSINTSALSPLQQAPDFVQSGGYFVTNQTVTFTLVFNRMYEVWQGGVKGPSDIGVRWDIRALERLMGLYDAVADKGGGTTGVGNYGIGSFQPVAMPVQIVFGGPNSMQFQGVFAGFDYTYTLFDVNMIPVEATADVSIMKQYQPNMSSADLVTPGTKTSLVQVSGMGSKGWTWQSGSVTRSDAPSVVGPFRS